jgi:hypothetical protein
MVNFRIIIDYFRIIDYLRFVRTTSPEVLYKQD